MDFMQLCCSLLSIGVLSLSCTMTPHQKESRPPWWIAVRKAPRTSAAVDVVVMAMGSEE